MLLQLSGSIVHRLPLEQNKSKQQIFNRDKLTYITNYYVVKIVWYILFYSFSCKYQQITVDTNTQNPAR